MSYGAIASEKQAIDAFFEETSLDLGCARWEGTPVEGRRFYGLSEGVTERALSLLRTSRGRRQFLWLHYFDPHEPYGDTRGERISLDELFTLLDVVEDLLSEHEVAAVDSNIGVSGGLDTGHTTVAGENIPQGLHLGINWEIADINCCHVHFSLTFLSEIQAFSQSTIRLPPFQLQASP